ncbi:hypothetical protein H5410_056513 [Solanum commersonii]|uniref:Uncharacterized protein n=1 Tax=Solanum commersonii TaxID=4109 RepID=A0A9J5WKG8_SOLCO|nr:hypothetical protein H5410_056513 [Solanum commersonii]
MTSEIRITKRSMDYSTQKLTKQEVYPFQATGSVTKVLMDVHKNFWQNDVGNPYHQKIHGLCTQKLANKGFTQFVFV